MIVNQKAETVIERKFSYGRVSKDLAQIAIFFVSDSETLIHPEPARFFEVPIQGPLPEELNYIP